MLTGVLPPSDSPCTDSVAASEVAPSAVQSHTAHLVLPLPLWLRVVLLAAVTHWQHQVPLMQLHPQSGQDQLLLLSLLLLLQARTQP